MSPIYQRGLQMLAEAQTNFDGAQFFWRIGPDVQRAIFEGGMTIRAMTPQEIDITPSRLASEGDARFCGLPAYLDRSMGSRIELVGASVIGCYSLDAEAVPA